MSIKIEAACPHCEECFAAKLEFQGRRVRCPMCQGVFTIPCRAVTERVLVHPRLTSIAERLREMAERGKPQLAKAAVWAGATVLGVAATRSWTEPRMTMSRQSVSASATKTPSEPTALKGDVVQADAAAVSLKTVSSSEGITPNAALTEAVAGSAEIGNRAQTTIMGAPKYQRPVGELFQLDVADAHGVHSVLFSPSDEDAFVTFKMLHPKPTLLTRWNVATGGQIGSGKTLPDGSEYEWAISPDGKLLAGTISGCATGVVIVRAEDLEIVSTFGTSKLILSMPVWSPDGKAVYFGTHKGQVVLCDLQLGRMTPVLRQDGQVKSIAITPDGRYLITGDNNAGECRVFDVQQSYQFVGSFVGTDHSVQSILTRAEGDGTRAMVISGGSGGYMLSEFDFDTRKKLSQTPISGQIASACVSADWSRAIAGHLGGRISVHDVPDGNVVSFEQVHLANIDALAISRDGTLSLSGGIPILTDQSAARLRGLPPQSARSEASVAGR